ncbi:MAG: hypothetical protein WCO33_05190 [bacterium]
MTSPTRRDPIGLSPTPKTRGVSPFKNNMEALIANSKNIAKIKARIKKMSKKKLERELIGPHKKYFDEDKLNEMQRAIHRAKVKIYLETCTPPLTAPSNQSVDESDEETLSANKKI